VWNDVASDWQERSRAALWRAHSDAVYAALLRRWLPAGPIDSVLKTDLFDEAVSAGLYHVLSTRARRIVGIDLARVTARQALRRHSAMGAATADVRMLPFASGSFDTIVSLSTLDHFRSHSDLEAGLAELRRVLRPGGVLILTLDNLANPLIRIRNALPFAIVHGAGLVPYYVGRSCTPGTAEAIVAQHGFRVDDRTTVLHVPRVAAVPAAAIAERWGGAAARARVLSALGGWERLAGWPTRTLTGHYVALRATKPLA
jgi:SAM-dependent methyltransferase